MQSLLWPEAPYLFTSNFGVAAYAPRIILDQNARADLQALIRAHSTPQSLTLRAQIVLRAATVDTPTTPALQISLPSRNESARCTMTPFFMGCSAGRFLFGPAGMLALFRNPARRREFAQYRRQCGRRHSSEHPPVGCRDRHHHAVVGLADLQRQIIAGHVIVALELPMNTA